jgi:hypothetical protein
MATISGSCWQHSLACIVLYQVMQLVKGPLLNINTPEVSLIQNQQQHVGHVAALLASYH